MAELSQQQQQQISSDELSEIATVATDLASVTESASLDLAMTSSSPSSHAPPLVSYNNTGKHSSRIRILRIWENSRMFIRNFKMQSEFYSVHFYVLTHRSTSAFFARCKYLYDPLQTNFFFSERVS